MAQNSIKMELWVILKIWITKNLQLKNDIKINTTHPRKFQFFVAV